MKLMQANNYVKIFNFKSSLKITFCPSCAYGKQTRNKFLTSEGQKENFMLDLVHSDVCGLKQTKLHNSFKYFLTFIDDKSIKSYVYFINLKYFNISKYTKLKQKPF
jgi:hypothetical protein